VKGLWWIDSRRQPRPSSIFLARKSDSPIEFDAAVTVHGLGGDWSIFRREDLFCEKTSAENMDLSPSRTAQRLAGDWSIFRRKDLPFEKSVSRKHGPVPLACRATAGRGLVRFSADGHAVREKPGPKTWTCPEWHCRVIEMRFAQRTIFRPPEILGKIVGTRELIWIL